MAASGVGRPQQLASLGEQVSHPAISRQGHRLAYEFYLADMNIWRVEVPGSHGKTNPPLKFISSTRYDSQAQYSPDGKKIAFGSDRSGSNEIWVCDSNGSNAVQVTSSGGALSIDPQWSPDSQRLVFGSNGEGQPEIYVVSINGGKPQRLTSDPADDQNPRWSHDGQWIYFDSNRSGEGIWKVPAQGGEALQVTRNGFGPIESPDGIFVFYHQKELDGNISLWKVPVEGGEERQVLEVPIVWFSFAITDEGIYFAPKAESAAGASIQFFSFATRSVKQIATIDNVGYGLSVSPDRRWIIYSQLDQAGSDLMLVENFH
jgi:Tol biopolymer transport system component